MHNYAGLDMMIEAGDFIKGRGTGCLGIVSNVGAVKLGKRTITGYHVTTARGGADFIPDADAMLVCPDEAHLLQVWQSLQAVAA